MQIPKLTPMLVEVDQLSSYWSQCAPLLEKGLTDSEDEIGVEHLFEMLHARIGMLLVGVDSDGLVHLAMALQFQRFPHYTVAHIHSIGGKGVMDNRQHWDAIKNWMKSQGASKVQGSCKPAQARLWQRLGLKPVYTIMRQDL